MEYYEREFEYHLSRKAILGWSMFFAICAAVFGYQSLTNERALEVNGLRLGPLGATIFFGIVAGFWSGCLVVGVRLLIRGDRIGFGKESLVLPAKWWSIQE